MYNSRNAMKKLSKSGEILPKFGDGSGAQIVSSAGTFGLVGDPQHRTTTDIANMVNEQSGGKAAKAHPEAMEREITLADHGNIPIEFNETVPGANMPTGYRDTVMSLLGNPRTVIHIDPDTGEHMTVGGYTDTETGERKHAFPLLDIGRAVRHMHSIYHRAINSDTPMSTEELFGHIAALSRYWHPDIAADGTFDIHGHKSSNGYIRDRLPLDVSLGICLRNIHKYCEPAGGSLQKRLWNTLPTAVHVMDFSPVSALVHNDDPTRGIFDQQHRLALVNHEDPDISIPAKRLLLPSTSADGTIDFRLLGNRGRLLGNDVAWANGAAGDIVNSSIKALKQLAHRGVSTDRFESAYSNVDPGTQAAIDAINSGNYEELSRLY